MYISNGVKEVKNIDKKSLAKITALIYGLVGFFTALIVATTTAVSIITNKDFQGSLALVIAYNFGAGLLVGVLTALITAGLGWVIGYIMAILYNWFAGKVGGIKVELIEAGEITKEEIKNQQYFKF